MSVKGLGPFGDTISKGAWTKRQLDRVNEPRLLFGLAALAASPSESGSDRSTDMPMIQAAVAAPKFTSLRDPLNFNLGSGIVPSSDDDVKSLKPRRRRSKKHRRKHSNTRMATTMGGVSPSRSPRLPSPPPFPEVQIGPKSPGFNPEQNTATPENSDTTNLDNGAMRRIRPGTKAADMASGPPLIPLAEVSSSTLSVHSSIN